MPVLDLSGARWHKSSYSSDKANCVEIAVLDTDRQASTRGPDANRVEVATAGTVVAMRDSTNPDGGVLAFSTDAWTAFTTALRQGQFG